MVDQAAYLDQLQQLLPPGAAWPRGAAATLTRLLDGLAAELARVDARGEVLLDELDPRTTLELLPDWERLVGLPDACAGTIAVSVPERRAAIVGKLTARGGQSIAYLTGLAQELGYAVAITEPRPSRLGCRTGDRLAGADWAFAFRVDVMPGVGEAATATAFRAGAGRSGDRLSSFGATDLECVLRRARPAHTLAIFAYPVDVAPAFDFDFTAGT